MGHSKENVVNIAAWAWCLDASRKPLDAQPSPACQSATLPSHLNCWEEYFTPWAKLQNKAVGVALLGNKSLAEHDWGNVPPNIVRPAKRGGKCFDLNHNQSQGNYLYPISTVLISQILVMAAINRATQSSLFLFIFINIKTYFGIKTILYKALLCYHCCLTPLVHLAKKTF